MVEKLQSTEILECSFRYYGWQGRAPRSTRRRYRTWPNPHSTTRLRWRYLARSEIIAKKYGRLPQKRVHLLHQTTFVKTDLQWQKHFALDSQQRTKQDCERVAVGCLARPKEPSLCLFAENFLGLFLREKTVHVRCCVVCCVCCLGCCGVLCVVWGVVVFCGE